MTSACRGRRWAEPPVLDDHWAVHLLLPEVREQVETARSAANLDQQPGFDSTRVVRLRIYMLQPSPSWHSHTLQHLAFYTFEPLAAPELAPEPELSQADKELCAKLAGGMAELTVMSHAIRATLDTRLAREGRADLAASCFGFLGHRVALDLRGWQETDIFAH